MRRFDASPRRATPKGHNLHHLHSTASESPTYTATPLRARGAHRIEHRLFSQITMNWRGRPLKTHQIIVDLIASSSTTTATGLTVHCTLDTGQYPTGITYTTAEVEALPLQRHDFHGDWNYTPATRRHALTAPELFRRES